MSSGDRVRQVTVTLAEVFAWVGAGPAFSIWSVIYLGLTAYTVWQ